MKLRCRPAGKEYEFTSVPLLFEDGIHSDVFAGKNNKTVWETLEHQRYAKFRRQVEAAYPELLQEPLGTFLLHLKRSGDNYYRSFLNKYGDERYAVFEIRDREVLDERGVYVYTVTDELKYIGRCQDSMRRRINQGYGKIHPKNCYIDGQATNCRLNGLITKARESVRLWLCSLYSVEIESVERALLAEYRPAWNLQFG